MRPLVVWALVLVVTVMVALGGCTWADWAGPRHDSHRYFEHNHDHPPRDTRSSVERYRPDIWNRMFAD